MEAINPKEIFSIRSEGDFSEMALRIFRFQYENCEIYKHYVDGISCNIKEVHSVEEIPFLPIEFFKTHQVVSFKTNPEIVFYSSGTTGSETSKHFVKEIAFYEESFLKTFTQFVGNPSEFIFLALLPSYLERKNSSLLYMMQKLIEISRNQHSGFYLYNLDELVDTIGELSQKGEKIILWGVSFSLLDMVEKYVMNFPNLIVFETGGMKGRRKEILREDLHSRLKKGFGVDKIYSEYGMSELLSQAYSKGENRFYAPPWMKIFVRNLYDPFSIFSEPQRNGAINVVDLANLYSCSFIATQDIGKLYADKSFEVLGRIDTASLRGCNLLVAD